MSLIQAVSTIKDDALGSLFCPVVLRLGVQALPATSLLACEIGLSSLLHYGVILPSPIGVELLEFPAKIAFLFERRRITFYRAGVIARVLAMTFRKWRAED